jgi:hypothetical protein
MAHQVRFRIGMLVLVVMVVVSGSALAKNTRTVSIGHDAKLNGTMIPSGSYEVSWQTHSPEATVTIADDQRVVVSTNGRWEARNIKYESNAVVYDTNDDGSRSILEIRFAGLKGALVFGSSSQ